MVDAIASRRLNKWKVAAACIVVPMVLVLVYQLALFISVCWYSVQNPRSSAFMRQTISELRSEDPKAAIRHQWVDYSEISPHLKRAVIASEDANFMTHSGVEWEAIRQALEYNRKQADRGSTRRRGGSTITQQLAKNLFLSQSRSYFRKAQELVLTYMIELVMSKQRILELYLNVAQWGETSFGAEAAARHYFKLSAKQLSANQAANLAAMLPNPSYYDKNRRTNYLRARTSTIQQRMRQVAIP